MGAGVYDIVLGLDEAALEAALAAAWGESNVPDPTYSTQDDSGDSWNFAVGLGTPGISLTGSSNGEVQLTLSITSQFTASDTTNPAKSFESSVTVQCPAVLMLEAAPPVLTVELISAEVSTGDPDQKQMLNGIVMPWLDSYLNSVLPSLALPAFDFEGVALADPLLGVDTNMAGDNVLLMFTGINPVTAPDSGTGAWPAASVFLAVDAALLGSLAAYIPEVSGSNQRDSISYDYKAYPALAGLVFQPGAGNSITGQVNADGPFDLEWHTPSILPNIYFSGNYSGGCSVTVDVSISTQGGYPPSFDISIKIAAVTGTNVQVTIGDIPLPDGFPLSLPDVPTLSISEEIGSAISNAVTGLSFDLGGLQGSAPVNSGLSLEFSNPAVTQFAAPGGVALLAVTATASWSR